MTPSIGLADMRIALTLGLLVALVSPARAGSDVGVLVTGEGTMQPQLTAQLESWPSQHTHTLVPSPPPAEAITLMNDCYEIEDGGCARSIFEQRAKTTTTIYAPLDTGDSASTSSRSVHTTMYWLDRGKHAGVGRRNCERCTAPSLRIAADEPTKNLPGRSDVGHVKFKSTPPGARITIDGQPIGVAPLDWDLPPGKHTILMDKDGFQPQSGELVVESNKTVLFGMKLVPPSDDDGGSKLARFAPIGLLATGGAVLITGLAMIYFDEDPSPDLGPTIHNTGPTGVGLAIGGAVAGGVGAYLLLFRSHQTKSTPVVSFTSDTAYIGWVGRF